jgi:hypothetical protein
MDQYVYVLKTCIPFLPLSVLNGLPPNPERPQGGDTFSIDCAGRRPLSMRPAAPAFDPARCAKPMPAEISRPARNAAKAYPRHWLSQKW